MFSTTSFSFSFFTDFDGDHFSLLNSLHLKWIWTRLNIDSTRIPFARPLFPFRSPSLLSFSSSSLIAPFSYSSSSSRFPARPYWMLKLFKQRRTIQNLSIIINSLYIYIYWVLCRLVTHTPKQCFNKLAFTYLFQDPSHLWLRHLPLYSYASFVIMLKLATFRLYFPCDGCCYF